MSDLEKYLKGEPLNEHMAALMEEPAEAEEVLSSQFSVLSKNDPITDDDREHLRRLLVEPGWQVLMQLLDSDLARQEDVAKRQSLRDPLGLNSETPLNALWAQVAYQRKAREMIVSLAEAEIAKLKVKAKK